MTRIDVVLKYYFCEETPSDEQHDAIEAFFGPELENYWQAQGFNNDGSDENTQKMIRHAIGESNINTHLNMLKDWLNEGF